MISSFLILIKLINNHYLSSWEDNFGGTTVPQKVQDQTYSGTNNLKELTGNAHILNCKF